MYLRVVLVAALVLHAGCAYRPTIPTAEDRGTAERLCTEILLGASFDDATKELRGGNRAIVMGGDRSLIFLALRKPESCACHVSLDAELKVSRSEAKCLQ